MAEREERKVREIDREEDKGERRVSSQPGWN